MTRARLLALSLLAAAFAIAGIEATAQEKKDAKKDPQSSYEPRSAPGAGQKFLAKFAGDWEVVKTFHPRSGKPFVQKGECRQKMVHDGHFLQSDFTFGSGDGKTTGTGLIGFETGSGAFTSVWTDSRATRMSFRKSKGPFDGKQIVLYGMSLGQAKESRVSRTVTTMPEDGKKIVHRQYTDGGDGKERLVMELVLTKKAP